MTGGQMSADVEAHIDELWDFSDPDASYLRFTEAVDQADASVAERLLYLTQAARALGLMARYEDAAAVLNDVRSKLGEVDGMQPAHHLRARLAIEVGRTLNSDGHPEQARPLFEQAYDEATAAGTAALAIDAVHMSAIVAGQLEGPEVAASLDQRALELAEAAADPLARRWRGSLLNNLAWDRHETGAHDEALSLFERAVEVRAEQGDVQGETVARWCVGRCLRSLERYDDALLLQQSLAAAPPGADDGYVHAEIGECLLDLGRPAEAAPSFARALQLLSGDPDVDDAEAERWRGLALLVE